VLRRFRGTVEVGLIVPIDRIIWKEFQRQLDVKGYKIKKGVIQDATFIEADLGKKRYSKEKKARKKGEEIKYTEKQKRHMNQHGSFSIKMDKFIMVTKVISK